MRFTDGARLTTYSTAALLCCIFALAGLPTWAVAYWPIAAVLFDLILLGAIDRADRP